MAQKIRSKQQSITLAGSTTQVCEFFNFGLSSILYQRGIYPAADFRMVKKYGLNMLLPTEESLQDYLQSIVSQLSTWLEQKQVSRLVLAIMSKETRETLERWQFEILLENDGDPTLPKSKSADQQEKDTRSQIQAMIKTICASSGFLPILEEQCTFNILAYTVKDVEVPISWRESDARMITGGQVEQVKLRQFSTGIHKVDASVAYRLGDDM